MTMSINVPRGPKLARDTTLKGLVEALEGFQKDYPRARIDLYRHAPFTVYVRVIDGVFKGKDFIKRIKLVFDYFQNVPDEIVSDVSNVLCLTPSEVKDSIENNEFEDPEPLAPFICVKCQSDSSSSTAKARPAKA